MKSVDEIPRQTRRLTDRLRRMVTRRLPTRLRARLGMLRGTFVKDAVRQLRRVATVLRHLPTYRQVDRALFYHRFAAAMVLAYRIGVFDALERDAQRVSEIADCCEIREESARLLLRILSTQNLVDLHGDEVALSPFAGEFFDPESDVSMVPMLEIAETYARAYPTFFESVKTGTPPDILDVFDDEGRVDALLDGVNSYLDQAGREVIARVDWPPIRHFIVGSMGVSFSSLILSEFPEAEVTYGCLPHLVERIPRLRDEYGVDPSRVVDTHAHGGQPDEDRWGREGFDLVFLTKKMILDPDRQLGDKFARKAHQVLHPGGIALFWETIHGDTAESLNRGMESFLDFGVSPTGPVLTEKTFRRKLRDIGFQSVEFVCCLEGATTFAVAKKA